MSDDVRKRRLDSMVELLDSLKKFRTAWLVGTPTQEDTVTMNLIALAMNHSLNHCAATMCLATAFAVSLKVLAATPPPEEKQICQ